MSFLAPLAFWIAAAVVPALVVLYFLKLRRREERVPSTLLWKRAVRDLQVNAPFQRLRRNLLLLLQLLVLLLAIAALAHPVVETTVSDERSVVILIDRSASMNAREGGQTRLEIAKEQAVRLLKTLNRGGGGWFSFRAGEPRTRVMVIAFAERAQVVSPFTTDTSALTALIREIEPTDGRTNMREALELAEAYMLPTYSSVDQTPVSPETPSKVVLVSDGAVADLDELVLKSGTLELLKVGRTRDNVGITALRTRRNYEQPEIVDVFLQVRNFGPEAVRTDVALYADGVLRAVRTASLAGVAGEAADSAARDAAAPGRVGSAASLSVPLTLSAAAVLEARLSRADALAADNRAYAVVPPPRKLRVLLVSKRNPFLEGVLAGLPLESMSYLTPQQYEAAPVEQIEQDGQSLFDVVVFDGHDTGRLPAGNYLFVGAVPRTTGIARTGKLGAHMLMWWDETHPVLRHVALDYVHVAEGAVLRAPPSAETLAEGPRGPVLLRYAAAGRHYLILSFAVQLSDWVIKPSFPVFVYNALRYLGAGGTTSEQEPTRPGDALRIPLGAATGSPVLTRPDGRKVSLAAENGRVARYAGTDRVGVYRVTPGLPGHQAFAVNLEDPAESDITPRGKLRIGAQQVAQVEAIRTATPEVWRWFVGAALLIVLLEWYIYSRRATV